MSRNAVQANDSPEREGISRERNSVRVSDRNELQSNSRTRGETRGVRGVMSRNVIQANDSEFATLLSETIL